MEVARQWGKALGILFYAVKPKDHMYQNVDDVPHYVEQVIPLFTTLIVLECVLNYYRGHRTFRLNDGFGSISQGILMDMFKFMVRTVQVAAYVYIYENFRLFTLPWDSHLTWLIAFFGADLGFYLFHRASHEINLFWAAHQVHHSSEDYNLTTALRQSILQYYVTCIFYLPLALVVPPSAYVVHIQFNLLYQFWIHTEVVDKLGPLEYVLNTPSHHRVHHGRNRYCIDSNYGGVLIIWDRMFGTFVPENEKVVYGLTSPINTFDPWTIQMSHYVNLFKLFFTTKGLANKLSVLFKGPGWSCGKPRLGRIEDVPDVHSPVDVYDPEIENWCKGYVVIHSLVLLLGYLEIATKHMEYSSLTLLAGMVFIFISQTTVAALLDKRNYASVIELLRCVLVLTLDSVVLESGLNPGSSTLRKCVSWLFVFSGLFWVTKTFFVFRFVTLKFHPAKKT